MTARQEVLARIAEAHRAAPPPDLRYADIERRYRTSSDLDDGQLHDRLIDRLLDYQAVVRHTAPDQIPHVIAQVLDEHQIESLVVPDGLDPNWLCRAAVRQLHESPDNALSSEALDTADGAISRCAAAIAETGTLILDGTPGQGRRALTLIPDIHLCVVEAGTIRADVPQALSRLDPRRPITMISGPSATSDIELSRVEGVHGPRTLIVVIVANAPVPKP